ncbi:PDZ domain-containing protein [Hydrogenimonas sp.]
MARIALLFLSLFLFFSPLFADGCFRFFPGSFKVIDGHPAYAVAKNRFVSLVCPTGKRTLVHDEFRGLCLFEDASGRPLYLTDTTKGLYFCPAEGKQSVKVLSRPAGVRPGRLSPAPGAEGAVFGSCCRMAGIVRSDGGWFDTKAIRRLMRGDTYHGDVGLRFAAREGKTVVTAVDPFARSGLRLGDEVVSVAGRKTSLRTLLEAVDRCKEGGTLTLGFLRAGEKRARHLACFERFGGGAVSDTFLERFGLRFDAKLRVVRLEKGSDAWKRGLRVGDRLLQMDGRKVVGWRDVREILTKAAETGRLPETVLWERAGFQFFLLPYTL